MHTRVLWKVWHIIVEAAEKTAPPSRTRRTRAAVGGVIKGSARYGQKKKKSKKMHLI